MSFQSPALTIQTIFQTKSDPNYCLIKLSCDQQNGLNLFYCSCAYFLFKSVQPNLEHVCFNDLLFDGQNKLLHPLQSLFCRGQIKPIFLRLDLCRLHHSLVAGPVIAKIGICLDELVKSYQGGQELAEFFEENLNLRK